MGSKGRHSTVLVLCAACAAVCHGIWNINSMEDFKQWLESGENYHDVVLNTDLVFDQTTSKLLPIGLNSPSSCNTYGGSFDGQNHTIFKAIVNNDEASFGGFFCSLYLGVKVKNLVFDESCSFSGSNAKVGALVGEWWGDVTVENVHNHANVSGKVAGGLIGGITGGDFIELSHCSNTGSITSTSSFKGDGAGGLIGEVSRAVTTVCDSNNTGTVQTTNGFSGGLCGYTDSNTRLNVQNFINKGNIISTGHSAFGIAEWITSANNVVNMGTIQGLQAANALCGNCADCTNLFVLNGKSKNDTEHGAVVFDETSPGKFNMNNEQNQTVCVADVLNGVVKNQRFHCWWQNDLTQLPVVWLTVGRPVNKTLTVSTVPLQTLRQVVEQYEALSQAVDSGLQLLDRATQQVLGLDVLLGSDVDVALCYEVTCTGAVSFVVHVENGLAYNSNAQLAALFNNPDFEVSDVATGTVVDGSSIVAQNITLNVTNIAQQQHSSSTTALSSSLSSLSESSSLSSSSASSTSSASSLFSSSSPASPASAIISSSLSRPAVLSSSKSESASKPGTHIVEFWLDAKVQYNEALEEQIRVEIQDFIKSSTAGLESVTVMVGEDGNVCVVVEVVGERGDAEALVNVIIQEINKGDNCDAGVLCFATDVFVNGEPLASHAPQVACCLGLTVLIAIFALSGRL